MRPWVDAALGRDAGDAGNRGEVGIDSEGRDRRAGSAKLIAG
jgi:hypothetical protein